MNYYLDSEGVARASLPLELNLLKNFLEEDLQGSTGLCQEIQQRLQVLQRQGEGDSEITGNAHHLRLNTERVQIEPLYSKSAPLELETELFREVIASWEALLRSQ
ncbi:MAG: hypothetical protein ACQETX_10610 [Pseudomonadota bacterium]|uniref:hypothetical protein n=1 Tax=Fodinicurvata fenggangensis TaxID=1121830 RepID=UPI00047CBBC1|nr:hypothetical protein [Fodinicurvata fenggangensis]